MHRFLLLFSELFPAFFCALPIGMGVGGAGLYVLFLTTFGHLPQVEAQGKNLLFFSPRPPPASCPTFTVGW